MPIARIASQVHAWVLVTTDLPESFSMRSITDAVRHLLQGKKDRYGRKEHILLPACFRYGGDARNRQKRCCPETCC